ncbi:MAG: YchJ family protein [Bdellovibrionales bacterium]
MKQNCPCGSTKSFAECCQRLHSGTPATSPEELMRARYTAFVVKNIEFVRDTTDPQSILEFDLESTKQWADTSEFFKLEVLRATNEGNKGIVEFKAHFRSSQGELAGKDQIHHELAKFRKQAGTWYFRDGRIVNPNPPSVGPS